MHSCTHLWSCEQPCPNQCNHSKCRLKCGEPCAPCQERCSWKCEHAKCTMKCHEPCNRQICMKSCKKNLKCGHKCVDLCGVICPELCRTCNKAEWTEIFFGNEDATDARFLQLTDCRHTFEINDLLKWLKLDKDNRMGAQGEENVTDNQSTEIQMKSCPKCKTVIRKTDALIRCINEGLKDIDLIKLKIFGESDANKLKQKHLLDFVTTNIKKFKSTPFKCNKKLREIHNDFELELNLKNVLGQHNLIRIDNMTKLWNQFASITNDLESYPFPDEQTEVFEITVHRVYNRLYDCLCFLKIFPNNKQGKNDINTELKLLRIVGRAIKALNVSGKNAIVRQIWEEAFQLALKPGPSRANDFIEIKNKIDEGFTLLNVLGISTNEHEMIYKTMGLGKGNWYK